MHWNKLLHCAAHRLATRTMTKNADEVGDELMFHFRKLVDEKLAEGLSFDAAWEKAEEQFGPMRRYDYECRSGQFAQRRKRRRLIALSAVAIVTMAGWAVFESRRQGERAEVRLLREQVELLRHEQVSRSTAVAFGAPAPRIAGGYDLMGTILDENDRPLEQATVLIIRKTWPGGGYRQEAFTATTNDEGHFTFPEFVPADDQYGIQVAALKEGFAFQSAYQLKDRKPIERPNPIALRLQRASQITLVVRDGNGQPMANVGVVPSARTPPGGKNEFIYFQGSEQVQKTTDAEGRVNLNYFLTGDQAHIYLHLPGDEWDRREFAISGDNQVVDLATSSIVIE
jgi:hypothetical protein